MKVAETALPGKHTGAAVQLYMAFELSDKKWLLVVSDGVRGPSRYTVDAGDKGAVLDVIVKAKARCALVGDVVVRSCYEAGRNGFWLHRQLIEQGIDNQVVDSASIEVNRRARRAKTDRLDGGKLLTMLMRYLGGERRVWSVVRVPTPQEEDARRMHRELERLTRERTAHTNRISSLLVLHNLRPRLIIGGRKWAPWWASHSEQVPQALRAEIERESARLALVKRQFKALGDARRQDLADGKQPLVAQLSQVCAIGPKINVKRLPEELLLALAKHQLTTRERQETKQAESDKREEDRLRRKNRREDVELPMKWATIGATIAGISATLVVQFA